MPPTTTVMLIPRALGMLHTLVWDSDAIMLCCGQPALIVLHNPLEETNGPHFLLILDAQLYQIDILRARLFSSLWQTWLCNFQYS